MKGKETYNRGHLLKPDQIIFLLFFLILFVFSFLMSSFRANISVELTSDRTGKFRFYWSGPKKTYNNSNTSAVRIEKGFGRYSQKIGSLFSAAYLRIDPLNRKGTVHIKEIKVTQPGFQTINFKTKAQFQAFVPINQIGQMIFDTNGLKITSLGVDPHLQVKLDPVFKTGLFLNHLKNVLFFSLGVSFIFYLFYRILQFSKEQIEFTLDLRKKRKGQRANLFAITFIIISLVRLIFCVTYPLNISGDGSTYFQMISNWDSHLALAGGYPFFFGIFNFFFESLNIFPPQYLAPQLFLLVIQHLTDIGMLVFMYLALEYIFDAPIASASVLFYSLNPFIIGNVSTTRPEWFQSDLFLVSLALAYFGYSTLDSIKKSIFYVSASLFFTLGFFVKYNLLPLASLFLLFIWFDTAGRKTKFAILSLITISCLSFYAVYIGLFHKPSTGTKTLTHDRSWVLMYKAATISKTPGLDIRNGINTKRYKLLGWFIWHNAEPMQGGPVTLYRNINSIPAKVRQPYREKYEYLLTADDEKLNRLFQLNPEAKNFYINQLIISYFIGLKESDELGVKVFLEAVRAEPKNYLKNVLQGFKNSFLMTKANNFPLDRELGWNDLPQPRSIFKKKHVKQISRLGFASVILAPSRAIGYNHPVLWLPGVYLFSLLSHPFYFWVPIAWFLCMILCIGYVADRWRKGHWSQQGLILLILTVLMIIFIFWSNMIRQFRQAKELIFILPYLCVFTGLFSVRVYQFLRRIRSKMFKK